MSTQDKIIEIIARQAAIDPRNINPETTLVDLGLNSLDVVESIFAIEETFDISVPFNAAAQIQGDFDITSVSSIAQGIDSLRA